MHTTRRSAPRRPSFQFGRHIQGDSGGEGAKSVPAPGRKADSYTLRAGHKVSLTRPATWRRLLRAQLKSNSPLDGIVLLRPPPFFFFFSFSFCCSQGAPPLCARRLINWRPNWPLGGHLPGPGVLLVGLPLWPPNRAPNPSAEMVFCRRCLCYNDPAGR